ncbi:MAG: helix-turn-helix transcriptional regulator [Bacilli bacterium]|nr:helix-turn-helix transcriptional regulator [Bacilli bacterium]
MNIQEQLGMRIKYLRKQRNLSQEQLAFECNLNKNYLCDIENGKRNPTLDILEKISHGLNITLEELFRGLLSFEE